MSYLGCWQLRKGPGRVKFRAETKWGEGLRKTRLILIGTASFFLLAALASAYSAGETKFKKIRIPPAGKIYHSCYPGGVTGEEDDITLNDLHSYEKAAGKKVAWVYFSNNWYKSRAFPLATAKWIRKSGAVPYIRLMLRDSSEQDKPNKVYTLAKILKGDFDAYIRSWARAARAFGSALIVEYGTEVNGRWFPWNGYWNGGGKTTGYGDPKYPDGPERFRDAYRRMISLMRNEGAGNITWVFHLNNDDWPDVSWNRFEKYYPGDAYVDWIGVSVYGALTPMEEEWSQFRAMMDEVYPRMKALTASKPMAVLEFGATKGNPLGDQAVWARKALADLIKFRWPRIFGFSWWNEAWENDDDPDHDTSMRLQDNPALAAVFKTQVGGNAFVLGRPLYSTAAGRYFRMK